MRRLLAPLFSLALLVGAALSPLVLIPSRGQDSSPYAKYFRGATTDPTPAREGQVYANTTSHAPKYYNGAAWKTFALIDSNQTFTGTQTFNNLTVTGTCTGCGAAGLSGLTSGQYLKATGATTATTDGVKRYVALLTQSGTSAPTATVLENSLGGTVVWARSSAGVYTGTLVGAFTATTALIISNNDAAGADSMAQYSLRRTSADVVTINTLNANWAGTEAPADDGLLNGTLVEIRVYP